MEQTANETEVAVKHTLSCEENVWVLLKPKKLLFYVKRPIMQIRGVADFIEHLARDCKELWNTYGDETCLRNFPKYVDFLQGRKTATFIRFTNFRELENPVPMEAISKVFSVLRMLWGGKYLNHETINQLTV